MQDAKCLVYQMRGYHVFCDWHKIECDHEGKSKFINHCKYCLVGMVVALREPWANEEGIPMHNAFASIC